MNTKTAMIVFGIVSLVCISGESAFLALVLFLSGEWFFAIISALVAFGPVAMLITACTGGGRLATLVGFLMLSEAIWYVFRIIYRTLSIANTSGLSKAQVLFTWPTMWFLLDAVLAVVCFIVCRKFSQPNRNRPTLPQYGGCQPQQPTNTVVSVQQQQPPPPPTQVIVTQPAPPPPPQQVVTVQQPMQY